MCTGDLRVIVDRIAKSFENTDYKIKEEKVCNEIVYIIRRRRPAIRSIYI